MLYDVICKLFSLIKHFTSINIIYISCLFLYAPSHYICYNSILKALRYIFWEYLSLIVWLLSQLITIKYFQCLHKLYLIDCTAISHCRLERLALDQFIFVFTIQTKYNCYVKVSCRYIFFQFRMKWHINNTVMLSEHVTLEIICSRSTFWGFW